MSAILVSKIKPEEKAQHQIPDTCQVSASWSVWECEPSSFDCHWEVIEKIRKVYRFV